MTRVKGGTTAQKRRRNLLDLVKGYRHGRSKKRRQATEAMLHAGRHSFAHRRDKKNDYRRLWITRLNAAVRENGLQSYSTFMSSLKKGGIELDRKVLAEIAATKPEVFTRITEKVK